MRGKGADFIAGESTGQDGKRLQAERGRQVPQGWEYNSGLQWTVSDLTNATQQMTGRAGAGNSISILPASLELSHWTGFLLLC